MRRLRLVRLVVRLAKVLEARSPQAEDGSPIDPSLMPLDLATRREPR